MNHQANQHQAQGSGKSRLLTGVILAGALGFLSACGDREPEGQVVAVVNGDEVTLQEVNAALGDTAIPEGQDEQVVRNAALGNVINRRLMAGIARDEGIETSPEYIVRRRQVEEALLVQMLSQKVARDMDELTPEEVDSFIASNPQMFAERKLFAANQIRFRPPARDDYLDALADVNTMDEAAAVLNRLGIEFERGNTRIDSGNLPTDLFRQVLAVGSGEPIIVPSAEVVTVSQILQVQDAPIAGEDARPVAMNTMRQRAVAEALKERLDTAKEEAGIDYQPGYGPAEGDDTEAVADNAAADLAPAAKDAQ